MVDGSCFDSTRIHPVVTYRTVMDRRNGFKSDDFLITGESYMVYIGMN